MAAGEFEAGGERPLSVEQPIRAAEVVPQSLGGTFAVERAPGGGTRISVGLPLQTVPEAVDEPERQVVV